MRVRATGLQAGLCCRWSRMFLAGVGVGFSKLLESESGVGILKNLPTPQPWLQGVSILLEDTSVDRVESESCHPGPTGVAKCFACTVALVVAGRGEMWWARAWSVRVGWHSHRTKCNTVVSGHSVRIREFQPCDLTSRSWSGS